MPEPSLLKSTIAGGVGGAFMVAAGHPLDTVKVKMQTMQVVPGQAPPYKGAIDCLVKTFGQQGIRGLYSGVIAPLSVTAPMFAICFFGFGVGKKIFVKRDNVDTAEDIVRVGLAGSVSAIFTTPLLTPMERVKCLMQAQGDKGKYRGAGDAFKKVYAEGGLRSLNRGFFATMGRDSVASFFYFSSNTLLKKVFTPAGESGPGVGGILLAGGIAGCLNWAMAMPLDVVKTRLQVSSDPAMTFTRAFRELMAAEGTAGLFRGFNATMMRAFPANAVLFLFYDLTIKVLDYVGME